MHKTEIEEKFPKKHLTTYSISLDTKMLALHERVVNGQFKTFYF